MAAVTVLMPCYNSGQHLHEALESLRAQTYQDFELLAIDDGSTDGTREQLREAARSFSRLRVLENPSNLGPIRTLNRGLAEVRTPWVARMDHDDVSLPRRLELQMAAAQRTPGAVLITAFLDIREPDGRLTPGARGIGFDTDLVRWHLLFYNRIGGHGQVCFRTDAARAAGGYDERMTAADDRAFWPRLLEQGPLILVRESLYQWRRHATSITAKLRTRHAPMSIEAGRALLREQCGTEVTFEQATLLRDFWMRYDDGSQDWDAAALLLLQLAERYRPRESVRGGVARLRATLAEGWLANLLRALNRRDRRLATGHLRRALQASGAAFPIVATRFACRLARLGGRADRLL